MATIEGCDGVVLEPEVEVIKGAPSGLIAEFSIPAATIFSFDSAELSEEGKVALNKYRDKLRPELAEAYEGVIIGHTDSTGDPDYNLELSKRRAESVRDYLIANGVSADKLRAIGRGDRAPLASNDTPEGRSENRRVEILVVGQLRDLDAMKFPSVTLFERRSAELTEQGKQLIEKNREQARDLLTRAAYVEIIGHTDDVGDDEYNLELSKQRAEAVRDYLVETGADASKIVALGAGEKQPIASNTTEEGRAKNRRVEVRVLGRMK
jgi:outer membrane protein OmpA-like peptidoglycan-associated protein